MHTGALTICMRSETDGPRFQAVLLPWQGCHTPLLVPYASSDSNSGDLIDDLICPLVPTLSCLRSKYTDQSDVLSTMPLYPAVCLPIGSAPPSVP